MSLIDIYNLRKQYSMSDIVVDALDGIDVSIDKSEFVALVGPSGSGKSTLMNMLGCLDSPTSGRYVLNGINVSNMSDTQLAGIRNNEIGFVFQNFNLIGTMTALDNVALPGRYGKINANKCRQMAKEALAMVGLSDRIKHYPNELSGGQQQRVAFARALLRNPAILLADEPTGNLDSKSGAEILNLMKELNRNGTTIIMVTHERKIADTAGREIELLDGKIIRDSKSEVIQ